MMLVVSKVVVTMTDTSLVIAAMPKRSVTSSCTVECGRATMSGTDLRHRVRLPSTKDRVLRLSREGGERYKTGPRSSKVKSVVVAQSTPRVSASI